MQLANGIEPGIHINAKSSAEMVYSTLAVSHATSILAAIDHWRVLADSSSGGDQNRSSAVQMAGIGSSQIPTTVINALGVDAAMELDYGDRL